MPEILPANEPVSETAASKPPRRRLSGCAWVVISLVLIFGTIAFTIGWPYYRAHHAIRNLNAKGNDVARLSRYNERPWHVSLFNESSFVPGIDDVIAELEGEHFDDDHADNLIALKMFEQLTIRNTNLTSDGLRSLRDIGNIEILRLDQPNLSDEDFQHMLHPNWQLTDVSLSSPLLTQSTWTLLCQLEGLSNLSLACPAMTVDASMPDLSTMTNLEELILTDMRISTDGMKSLSKIPNLIFLHLESCELPSLNFPEFPSLLFLAIETRDGMAIEMSDFRLPTSIGQVTLRHLNFDEVDPLLFASFTELGRLDLLLCSFTDEHLRALASCTKLSRLNLTGCKQVGDAQIPLLLTIPNLQSLDLTGTSVSQAGVDDLKSRKPSVKVIHNLPVE